MPQSPYAIEQASLARRQPLVTRQPLAGYATRTRRIQAGPEIEVFDVNKAQDIYTKLLNHNTVWEARTGRKSFIEEGGDRYRPDFSDYDDYGHTIKRLFKTPFKDETYQEPLSEPVEQRFHPIRTRLAYSTNRRQGGFRRPSILG